MMLQPMVAVSAESILPLGYRVTEVCSTGRRRFVRACPGDGDATGVRAYSHSASGLCVSAAHVRYESPVVETFPSAVGVMKIHVRLEGPSRVGFDREPGRPVREMSCSALIHPSGEAKLERFDGALEERSVTVACSAEFLSNEFGVEGQSLPRQIAQFLDGTAPSVFGVDVPLLLDTRRAAELICDEFGDGAPQALMIESRALELLARFFEQARRLESGAEPARLLARDRRIAESARALLEERFADPPGLKALARDVGTHPAKLMRLFKAVHGSTISGYLEAFRMERARQLLDQGDLPVTQIAYEVGYEHPSNFATAFKRRYGLSPSAVRARMQLSQAA